jgi:pyridoxamine 5'-phosphate oxidase
VNDPFPQLRAWIDQGDSNDMCLATTCLDGVPSVRIVSLRGIEPGALRFFTHAGSRKVDELTANPRAAALLWFPVQRRQLRVEGVAEPLPRDEVEAYFATRPRPAQLAATVSRQGRPSPGIAVLRAQSDALDRELGAVAVPCPDDFVGYRLIADVVEFWQGDSARMHERITYLRAGAHWRTLALQP